MVRSIGNANGLERDAESESKKTKQVRFLGGGEGERSKHRGELTKKCGLWMWFSG
jgi:hypothetical protein